MTTTATINPLQPTVYTLAGENIVIDNSLPVGDFEWGRTCWATAQDTWNEVKSRTPSVQMSIVQKLRQARREGSLVVAGVVQPGSRRAPRPAASTRARRGDIESLVERSRGLVRQIAELTDRGPIPDGTMAELTKTVASLQDERDEIMGLLAEVEGNISLGRGLVIEYSMAP